MATIPIPTSPGFSGAKATVRSNSALAVSPYNGTQQAYRWGPSLRIVEFTLPPMIETDADNWTDFFEKLEGMTNTFTADLTQAFPHDTGADSVQMRLMSNDVGWDVDTAKHYGFTFTAMEAR